MKRREGSGATPGCCPSFGWRPQFVDPLPAGPLRLFSW